MNHTTDHKEKKYFRNNLLSISKKNLTIKILLIILFVPIGWNTIYWNIFATVFISILILNNIKSILARLILLSTLILVSTIISSITKDIDYFQLIRGLAPFFIIYLIPVAIKKSNLSADEKTNISTTLLIFGLLSTVFFMLNIPLANVAISINNEGEGMNRLYVMPFHVYFVFYLFFLKQQKSLLALIAALILLASGGRSSFIILTLLTSLHIIQNINSKKSIIMIVTTIIIIYLESDQLQKILWRFNEIEDDFRVWDFNEGLKSWLQSFTTFFIGNGFGFPLSEGFAYFGGDADARVSINSMYELHNLYIQLLARLGIIGTIFVGYIFYKDHKHNDSFSSFLIIILVLGISSAGSILSIDGAIMIIIYSLFFSKHLRT